MGNVIGKLIEKDFTIRLFLSNRHKGIRYVY